jgi:uncharacterized protein YjiS (DUF1127 family)
MEQERNMTDIALIGRNDSYDKRPLSLIITPAKTAFEVLREWRRRYRTRQELALFSYHERNDVPFAGDVDGEITKPFWKK